MNKERIRSVGISFLGRHSGIEGQYKLGIDSIRAVNEEDAEVPGEIPTLVRSPPLTPSSTARNATISSTSRTYLAHVKYSNLLQLVKKREDTPNG